MADILLDTWFVPDKVISDLTSIETDTVGDVEKVSRRTVVPSVKG